MKNMKTLYKIEFVCIIICIVLSIVLFNWSGLIGWLIALFWFYHYNKIEKAAENIIRRKEQENEFLNLYINSLKAEVNEILKQKNQHAN